MRLLRSHATGLGDRLPEEVVRGHVADPAGAAGGRRRRAAARARRRARRAHSARAGSRGCTTLGGSARATLTALAQLGLALPGGRGWHGPEAGRPASPSARATRSVHVSSNAATFAAPTLAWARRARTVRRALGVAALTFRALDGNPRRSPSGRRRPAAARARRRRGACGRAVRRRRLLAARRLQDPFALRACPRSPAHSMMRSPRPATCCPSSSTPPPRTRCSPTAPPSTTAASTRRRSRSRSTRCGSRSCRSGRSPRRASPRCSSRRSADCRPSSRSASRAAPAC